MKKKIYIITSVLWSLYFFFNIFIPKWLSRWRTCHYITVRAAWFTSSGSFPSCRMSPSLTGTCSGWCFSQQHSGSSPPCAKAAAMARRRLKLFFFFTKSYKGHTWLIKKGIQDKGMNLIRRHIVHYFASNITNLSSVLSGCTETVMFTELLKQVLRDTPTKLYRSLIKILQKTI